MKLLGSPRKLLVRGGLAVLGLVVVLQLLPFGRDHSNPAVAREAPWPDARSRALARTACYDCHSNQTHWPFYSYVAPMSWLLTSDVQKGRDKLNFSEWGRDAGGEDRGGGQSEGAHEAADVVEDGRMPPGRYTLTHPDARLSDAERQVLIDALDAMDQGRRGGDGGGGDGGDGGGDHSGPGGGGGDG